MNSATVGTPYLD